MSVSLHVLPGESALPSWITVYDRWKAIVARLGTRYVYVPNPVVIEGGVERPVSHDEHLRISSNGVLYGFVGTTLCLLNVSTLDFGDEAEFVEDYGTNLPAESRTKLAMCWSAAGGHYFHLESYSGRTDRELLWFPTLGCAIAEATSGWVVISNNPSISLSDGIYLPAEVLSALGGQSG